MNDDAAVGRPAYHDADLVGGRGARDSGDVKPDGRGDDLEMIGKIAAQCIHDQTVTRTIDFARLADVTGESAAVDELRQHGLDGGRGVPISQKLRLVNGLSKRGWGDDESQAQRGQQRLRERTDVYDSPRRIEHPERFDRTPSEAKLAVVIVLDDRGIVAVGPGQERQSAR